MSSINSNSPRTNTDYTTTNVNQTSQTDNANSIAPTTTGLPQPVATDGYSQTIGQSSNVLGTPAPVAADNKPANYQANLQGAQDNLAPYANGQQPTPAETSLIGKENQAEPSKADKDTASRQKKASSQADSIVSSAEEGGKHGCKHKYDNHDLNVSKMQKLGFTKKEAENMTHMLEDGRTPADVKTKLAYQLAALGMTGGTSSKVTAPVAGNADLVKKQVADFADFQGKVGSNVGVGYEMKHADQELNKLTVADMRTQYQAPAAADYGNTGTLGAVQPNLLGQTPKAPSTTDTAVSSLSPTTQTQSAVSGAALGAAYPNLTQT